MSNLIPFASIIGVIVGFCLGLLKDWITNKPKLKAELSSGKFEYYHSVQNEIGEYERRRTDSNQASVLQINLTMDIFNVGKMSTAVKDILIELHNKGAQQKRYFKPTFSKDESRSFNVAVGSIITKNLILYVQREEDTEAFFQDVILIPDSDERLLIKVLVRDIYKKDVITEVEPFSIVTAY
ncbi:hypothetical protein P9G84_10165 [Brevibacillus centrosporus]|uniref:hypothetical protein n=1 Tax=Brevibacillus centrosporus TaxID=54910 RepID=UPI00114198A7|nr:hypothetical protein [Brevibacillus centrosporus]MEC2129332.1 hypothetical protein [Brevibacillus centrosporus]GED33498.1 hypothetical protein BCE02nite_46390 [Brevibacillus centrosporus]